MMFGDKWLQEALVHAEREFPKESCGFIVNGVYLPRKNIHESPEGNFTISGIGYASATKKGPIQAVVHSHPDGTRTPSGSDLQGQHDSGVPWCILPRGKQLVWLGVEEATTLDELVGRQFLYGVHDCYTLIKSAYKVCKGVELPSFPSDWLWWENGKNYYMENYERMGFRRLAYGEQLQPFDVLMGAVRSDVVNHAALYLGDNIMLHHMVGRLSCRESILRWLPILQVRVRYCK